MLVKADAVMEPVNATQPSFRAVVLWGVCCSASSVRAEKRLFLNPRAWMSHCSDSQSTFSVFPTQFLCLKNIRTFLLACSDVFGMRKSELFESFDLFDVRDFGKVRQDCPVTQWQFQLSFAV